MASQPAQPRIELKVARIRAGFNSQQAAADAMGLERRIVQRAESGGGIRLEHALKLAAFYGLDPLEIWPVEDEKACA